LRGNGKVLKRDWIIIAASVGEHKDATMRKLIFSTGAIGFAVAALLVWLMNYKGSLPVEQWDAI
jgi:hypothetical protein